MKATSMSIARLVKFLVDIRRVLFENETESIQLDRRISNYV